MYVRRVDVCMSNSGESFFFAVCSVKTRLKQPGGSQIVVMTSRAAGRHGDDQCDRMEGDALTVVMTSRVAGQHGDDQCDRVEGGDSSAGRH